LQGVFLVLYVGDWDEVGNQFLQGTEVYTELK